MSVTIRYLDGCPSWQRVRERLRAAAREVGVDLDVRLEPVETLEEAKRLGLPGSPTILLEGVDPFARARLGPGSGLPPLRHPRRPGRGAHDRPAGHRAEALPRTGTAAQRGGTAVSHQPGSSGVAPLPTRRRAMLGRRAQLLAGASVAYNLVEAAVAVAAGSVAGSIALVGFGLDSLVEVSSGLVILWQFRHRVPEHVSARRCA